MIAKGRTLFLAAHGSENESFSIGGGRVRQAACPMAVTG